MLVPTGAEGIYEYDPSIPAGSGGGGGGGSSDFSTAKVTFTNNSTNAFKMAIANLYDEEMYEYIDYADMDGSEFEIVLYKGQGRGLIVDTTYPMKITTSGAVNQSNNAAIYVEGDGAVTIEDGSSPK